MDLYSSYTSIFVVHEGMNMDEDGPEWDSHEYWKMKILSMHKDNSSGERWVVGYWFYTPSQLREIKLKDRYLHLCHLSLMNAYSI